MSWKQLVGSLQLVAASIRSRNSKITKANLQGSIYPQIEVAGHQQRLADTVKVASAVCKVPLKRAQAFE